MPTPVVSVVIPTHNRPEMLREALESVARQIFVDWEAVVVDDASDPPASPWGGVAAEPARIRLVRHETARGGAAAKNSGIMAAKGEYVAFLDDDDRYDATYLETAVRAMRAHPGVDVAFMGVSAFGPKAAHSDSVYAQAMRRTLDRAGGQALSPNLVSFDDGLVRALLKSVPMAFQRPVVRRAALSRIGVYRDQCFLWDCDWAIRAALAARTILVNEALYQQRAGDHAYSSAARRRLDSALSNVEIMETLLQRAESDPAFNKWRAAFLEAAAASRLDLALFYRTNGDVPNAFRAWVASQRHVFSPRRFTFLARLAATAMERSVHADGGRTRQ